MTVGRGDSGDDIGDTRGTCGSGKRASLVLAVAGVELSTRNVLNASESCWDIASSFASRRARRPSTSTNRSTTTIATTTTTMAAKIMTIVRAGRGALGASVKGGSARTRFTNPLRSRRVAALSARLGKPGLPVGGGATSSSHQRHMACSELQALAIPTSAASL